MPDELPAQELGSHDSRTVFLTGEASPSFNQPEEFVAVLYYNSPQDAENVEVAVVDTTHGAPHLHRNYLYGERDETPTDFDGGFWDALSHLEENWRVFVHKYLTNSE